MTITTEMLNEMNILLQFPENSMMNGIKIHHDADPALIDATKRLYNKGFIDQPDGGYLTDAGIELHEHLRVLNSALRS